MIKIADTKELQEKARLIRHQVFVIEQGVAEENEFDQHEAECRHFLAIEPSLNIAIGTARWRNTDKGIKLERFAVLSEFRKTGVGSLLLEAVLSDITQKIKAPSRIYLHAQTRAANLYLKAGFSETDEVFEECGIPHILMEKQV